MLPLAVSRRAIISASPPAFASSLPTSHLALPQIVTTMDDSDDLFGGLPAALKAENVPATTGASSTAITNTTKNHQPKNIVADGMEFSRQKKTTAFK